MWGTSRIFGIRHSVTVNDNDWGFGQILPVFLLIGPIVTVVEAIAPEGHSEEASGRVVPGDGRC